METPNQTNGSATPTETDKRAKDPNAFFASIKDQMELVKGVVLGLAILAAPQVVLESSLAEYNKVIGAVACVMLGFWMMYCAIALYFQHRLKIRGLPLTTQVARIGQYAVLCVSVFFAGELALQARAKIVDVGRRSDTSVTESTQVSATEVDPA